ncbi:hypothetical protein PIB30_009801 [Stylosanthes scabra]|uniref:Uncharacterized protein n=1 Tax=Stylosanthes scabra TaxID=79078 RepID=A0ABU6Y3P3_9FABA|nr:hypothetical protein [Stylosanthes scabra]
MLVATVRTSLVAAFHTLKLVSVVAVNFGMLHLLSLSRAAYISIIALIVCTPPAVILEGPALIKHVFNDAIAKVGLVKFVSDLFWVGGHQHTGKSGISHSCSWQCTQTCICYWIFNHCLW